MDIVYLEYFCKVAELQHVTKAAQILNVGQSTLSFAIRKLENEFETRLFQSSGRNIVLTEQGKLLYKYAVKILADYNGAKDEIRKNEHIKYNKVNIVCPPPLLDADVLSKIKAQNPNLILSTTALLFNEDALNKAIKDRLLIISHLPFCSKQYETMRLCSDPYFVVFSDTHPLVRKEQIYIQDLKNESFVAFSHFPLSHRGEMDALCNEAGFTPQIVYEVDSSNSIPTLLRSEHLIAMIPAGSCRNLKNYTNLVIRRLLGIESNCCIGISWPKDYPLTSNERIIRDAFIEVYHGDEHRLTRALY